VGITSAGTPADMRSGTFGILVKRALSATSSPFGLCGGAPQLIESAEAAVLLALCNQLPPLFLCRFQCSKISKFVCFVFVTTISCGLSAGHARCWASLASTSSGGKDSAPPGSILMLRGYYSPTFLRQVAYRAFCGL
jgi:hypothetical protein